MNHKHQIVDKRGGNTLAINDKVEVFSTSNDELYGQQGIIIGIKAGELGTEVKVMLENGMETWIDAEEVFSF